MREILFRGKRKDNGEWVEGDLLKYGRDYDTAIRFVDDNNYGTVLVVNPETVGQYTGLVDKNGKKIFEGDILEHHVQGNILVNSGVVNWDEKNARWAHRLNIMNPDFTFYNPDAYEVIGNIHDNPELLQIEG